MAIIKNTGRQEVISATVDINFSEVAGSSGAVVAAIDLPEGAVVLSGNLITRVVFNSGTSDTMIVELDTVDLLAATSIAAIGNTPLTTGSVAALTAANTVDVIWTGVGAVPTTGDVLLVVNYIVEGRTAFSQG